MVRGEVLTLYLQEDGDIHEVWGAPRCHPGLGEPPAPLQTWC